jgi:hypothetical protein
LAACVGDRDCLRASFGERLGEAVVTVGGGNFFDFGNSPLVRARTPTQAAVAFSEMAACDDHSSSISVCELPYDVIDSTGFDFGTFFALGRPEAARTSPIACVAVDCDRVGFNLPFCPPRVIWENPQAAASLDFSRAFVLTGIFVRLRQSFIGFADCVAAPAGLWRCFDPSGDRDVSEVSFTASRRACASFSGSC